MDLAASGFLDPESYYQSRVRSSQGAYYQANAGAISTDAAERMGWQNAFRRRFSTLLGGLEEWERVPLDAVVSEVRQMEGYHREAVTFATRPGLQAFGYYLVPDDCPPGRPAILCVPGHGRGVDSIVGIGADGTQRSLPDPGIPGRPEAEYQADFALQCVANGYPTFALEQISFGHRRDARAMTEGPEASSCRRDSTAALMLGETISGWRVWDALRALDYLQTRTEVGPNVPLSVMGISGGGLTALFAAALDTRIEACVVSGYFNTWADSILSIDHCVDNYVPDLLSLCEMPDLAALVASRALFVESGRKDPIFPLEAFERAASQGQKIYQAFGAPERFASEIFDSGHLFYGVGAFRFLNTLFKASFVTGNSVR